MLYIYLCVCLCLCQWPCTIKLASDANNPPVIKKYRWGRLFLQRSRVGHALRPIFMLWLVKIWQWVHAENLCSILKLVYFDRWSCQSFVSTCNLFNCLFPLDVQNEIQLISRVFRYSWLVCLLFFWLRDTSLLKVGNPISDGIVLVFHLA